MSMSQTLAGERYYRESGRVPVARLTIALMIATAFLGAAACIYAYCDLHSPIGFLTGAFTVIYSLLAGFGVGWIVQQAHIRNRAVRDLTRILFTLASLYLPWCFWLYDVFRKEFLAEFSMTPLTFALHPKLTWDCVRLVNGLGTWSIANNGLRTYVNGPLLWVVWAIEALIILLSVHSLVKWINKGRPFCESCGRWTKSGRQFMTLSVVDTAPLRAQLESGNFVPMIQQAPVKIAARDWLSVHTHSCEKCKAFHTLTVKREGALGNVAAWLPSGRRVKINRLLISTVDLKAMQAVRAEYRASRLKMLKQEVDSQTDDANSNGTEEDESASPAAN
jgi:hypothetical protein